MCVHACACLCTCVHACVRVCACMCASVSPSVSLSLCLSASLYLPFSLSLSPLTPPSFLALLSDLRVPLSQFWVYLFLVSVTPTMCLCLLSRIPAAISDPLPERLDTGQGPHCHCLPPGFRLCFQKLERGRPPQVHSSREGGTPRRRPCTLQPSEPNATRRRPQHGQFGAGPPRPPCPCQHLARIQ